MTARQWRGKAERTGVLGVQAAFGELFIFEFNFIIRSRISLTGPPAVQSQIAKAEFDLQESTAKSVHEN